MGDLQFLEQPGDAHVQHGESLSAEVQKTADVPVELVLTCRKT
jgi:hypothetical protein